MYFPEIPCNGLKTEIEEIKKLVEALHERRKFEFSPPASMVEISEWEKTNGFSIPSSFVNWLLFSNGSILRGTVAELYGLNQIIVESDYFPKDYVVIGSLGGDGEVICFSKSTGKIFSDDHGDIYNYDDFKEVLEEIIEDIKGMW